MGAERRGAVYIDALQAERDTIAIAAARGTGSGAEIGEGQALDVLEVAACVQGGVEIIHPGDRRVTVDINVAVEGGQSAADGGAGSGESCAGQERVGTGGAHVIQV